MITIEELSNKYGYCPYTIKMLLCRAEFCHYIDKFGRIKAWDELAEERLKRIIAKKQRGRG